MDNKRTSELPATLDRVRDMAAKARERQASEVFALDAVREAMRAAAGEGMNMVAIAPGKAVDLRKTEAAKATQDTLEAEGFKVEWMPEAVKPGEAPAQVLVIRW